MKKTLLIILALIMLFTMTACSGTPVDDSSITPDGSEETEAIVKEVSLPTENPFVKVTIPEGWEYNETRSTPSQVYITKIDSSYPNPEFQFNKSSRDMQDAYDHELEFWGESRTLLEDKMYGTSTYKRLGFTWNDAPSVTLFTDWADHEGDSIEVSCFCIDPEDPIIQELMQSASYF